jgi:Domain of unknown function (DUF4156)
MEWIFWPLLGVLIGLAAARKKGFSQATGVVGGALLGPLAFLMFAVSGATRGEKNKKCPHCAEWIKDEARVCKHCGRDVVTTVAILVVLLLAVVGCKTLTPEGAQVRVTSNPEVVRGCRFLGNVRDDGSNAAGSANRVEDMLRSKTAALGGNVLMITSTTATPQITTMSGEAYSCPQP